MDSSSVNPSGIMTRFRSLKLFHQALIVMAIFFVVNTAYLYFTQPFTKEVLITSVSSALLFLSVYYFISVILTKKSAEYERKMKGPRKGMRKT